MAVSRTAAENGSGKKITQQQNNMPLQRIPAANEPQALRWSGGPLSTPGVFHWVIGLIVCGLVMMAVVICTAVVYKQRLGTLQGRVDALEQYCLDIETTMKNYVDETLRSLYVQQVYMS